MKKLIIIAAIVACNYVKAQTASPVDVAVIGSVRATTTNDPEHSESTGAAVGMRITKAFSNRYTQATKVFWSVDKGGAICTFFENDVLHRAYYKSNGAWTGTVITGKAAILPAEINESVTTYLPEYRITLVQEVDAPGYKPTYLVQMKSLNYFKIVKVVSDSEPEVIQDLERAD